MTLDYSLIGKRIKQRRKRLDLTQEEVAERIDISNQHMSNIERAKSIPSTEVIMSHLNFCGRLSEVREQGPWIAMWIS